jgi:RHS repeat-associated protein
VRLSHISRPDTKDANNGAGQRTKKVTQTETRVFHYDLWGHLIAETNQIGLMLAEYVYLGDQLLAMIKPGESVYYYHNDHLGTPQVLTDDTGTIAWKAVYTPFGEAVASIQTVENPFRFPGQYYDPETGLHYNYFRYYNPQTGRYITPDPIGLEGGINLFSYVENNLINWVDPIGLTEYYVTPFGLGGTFAVGDWKHFSFGFTYNVSVSLTTKGFLVFQSQFTFYDKVFGAYLGGGRVYGGGFNALPTKEGFCGTEKPQKTLAGGAAWKNKGGEIQIIGDENNISLQSSAFRSKNAVGYGGYIAKGETYTMQTAVDIKPYLVRIVEIIRKYFQE